MRSTNLTTRTFHLHSAVLLTLISIGLSSGGYAQTAVAPNLANSPTPDDRTYIISGTVLNAVTGEPIRRAATMLRSHATPASSDRITLTDGNGCFSFQGVARGRVYVVVNKPGFLSERGNPDEQIGLRVGPDATLVVRMTPAGVIAGRVTNQDKDPVGGLFVQVFAKQGGRQRWNGPQFQAVTDENGTFRIANVPPSTYNVATAQSQPSIQNKSSVQNVREKGFAQVFYPGVSEPSAAAPLLLNAGEELRADLTLTAEPFIQITGVVTSPDELRAALTFERQAGEGFDFKQSAAIENGRFRTMLPAGSYIVRGFAKGGPSLSTTAAPVVVTSDSSAVQIVMVPAMRIPVLLQRERSGGVIEHIAESDGQEEPDMSIRMMPKTRATDLTWPFWLDKSADKSEIENVEPGIYTVKVDTAGPWRVKSIQAGGVDLMAEDLTIRPGAQPPTIEVTLSDDAATLDGVLLQADEQEAIALLVPASSRGQLKTAPTEDGKFHFEGIAPGDYALIAVAATEQSDYTNLDGLNPDLSHATRISLQARGKTSVNLTLSSMSR